MSGVKGGGKKKEFYSFCGMSKNHNAVSSRAVLKYQGVFMDEKWRADIAVAEQALREVDMRYISPSLDEAERLMKESYKIVMSNYDGNAYLRTDMQHGSTITNGQMLRYCQQIWHDSELYQLGTRWRPAQMPKIPWNRSRKETRGGISLPDQYQKTALSVTGCTAICQGLAPVLAGMRIRLNPEIAKKTHIFQIFHDFVDFTPGLSNTSIPRVVSDWDSTPSGGWSREQDEDSLFGHEEEVMAQVMTYLKAEYSRTLGQFHGANALPGVSWSAEDFVDHLMTWWSEAEINASGRLRYVPSGLEKGGLEMHETGDSFSCQGKAAWQGALMAMTASLMCGIPAPIAALLNASNFFWNQICREFGPDAVRTNRKRLLEIRDSNKHTWLEKRPQRSTTARSSDDGWRRSVCEQPSVEREEWKRNGLHSRDSSTACSSPCFAEDPFSIDQVLQSLRKCSEETKRQWVQAKMVTMQTPIQISSYLTALGKAIVGTATPNWTLTDSGGSCVCVCDPIVCLTFYLLGGFVGAKSAEPASIQLLAAIACGVPPSEILKDQRFATLVDLMVEVCLKNVEDVPLAFSKQFLKQVKTGPVKFDPPKSIMAKDRMLVLVEETETHFLTIQGQWIARQVCSD
jgi:hypothetical protein